MSEKQSSKQPHKTRVDKLIELLDSLETRKNVFKSSVKREIPEGFGWRETEQEYQKAQQEWLRQLAEKKQRQS